jgi:hypothetical protein
LFGPNTKFGLSVFLNYPCIPSPSISPDNRDYTVVPTIIFESPKGPSDEKCLGSMNPLIRPCYQRLTPIRKLIFVTPRQKAELQGNKCLCDFAFPQTHVSSISQHYRAKR